MKQCTKCGETRPLTAYELLPTGGYRGTCKDCRRVYQAEAKRLRREAKACQPDPERDEAENLAWQAQRDREQQRRDDLWSAMWTGRSRRSVASVLPHSTATHRLKLKDSARGGYITAGEFACRCEERAATIRAVKSSKEPEDARKAMRVLRQGMASLERRKALWGLWQETPDPSLLDDDSTADPFAEAFGDWAPSWMGDRTPPSVYA